MYAPLALIKKTNFDYIYFIRTICTLVRAIISSAKFVVVA